MEPNCKTIGDQHQDVPAGQMPTGHECHKNPDIIVLLETIAAGERMFRKIGLVAGLLAQFVGIGSQVARTQVKDTKFQHCHGADPGLTIEGCTALIEVGQQNLEELSSLFNLRGLAYRALNHNDKAVADFDEAIRLQPGSAIYYYDRGQVYEALAEYDKALADFDRAIELKHNYAEAFYFRGYTRALHGENEKAISDFTEAIRLRPDFTTAYNDRALVYLKMGKEDLALSDYEVALHLNARLATSLYGRGLLRLKDGDALNGENDIKLASGIDAKVADKFRRWGAVPPAANRIQPVR